MKPLLLVGERQREAQTIVEDGDEAVGAAKGEGARDQTSSGWLRAVTHVSASVSGLYSTSWTCRGCQEGPKRQAG